MNPRDPSATPPASCPEEVDQRDVNSTKEEAHADRGIDRGPAHAGGSDFRGDAAAVEGALTPSAQQGAAPAQEWRSPGGDQTMPDMLERAASLLLSGLEILKDDLLTAAEHLRAAPTPEYVAGWLAAVAHVDKLADGRGSTEMHQVTFAATAGQIADSLRALAPPSAPPVSDDRRGSDGCRFGCGLPSFHPGDCVPLVIDGKTEKQPANDDRLLLLKALVSGVVSAGAVWRKRETRIVISGHCTDVPLDSEGFPVLTDSLRAALTEATK